MVINKGRMRWAVVISGMLLALASGLLLGALVPPAPVRDDLPGGMYHVPGAFDPPGNAQGFYKAEPLPGGQARWSGPLATITFPYAAQLGRYATIRLRLAAPGRPPAPLTLGINSALTQTIPVGPDWQIVTLRLDTAAFPNPYLHPAHIQIDLQT